MVMSQISFTDQRAAGQRYLVAFPIRAEWDDDGGEHIIEEGKTENVGPQGTLVYLQRLLPRVGSRITLHVMDDEQSERLAVTAEVLRLERNAAHPQAALMLVDDLEDWQHLVWQQAAVLINQPEDYDEFD